MIEVEREIRALPAEVWAVMSDLDRWEEILPTVDESTRIGVPGPIGTGTRFRVRQPGLATAEYEVVDWRPGEAFTWTAEAAGVRTEAVHEAHPSGDGTRIRLGITWSGPLAWLAKLVFTGKARRYMTREAEVFARIAEQGRS